MSYPISFNIFVVVNKYLVIAVFVLVAFALFGLLTSIDYGLTSQADIILAIAEKVALIMMLINGTFYSTVYFKITKFLFGMIIIGGMMKIMHWPGADELLLISIMAIGVVYTIHFSGKKPKMYFDFMS